MPPASTGREPTDKELERTRLRAIAATHSWVGAVTIPLSATQARTADLRAAVTIKADTRVHVLDAYCASCKRNYEALVGVECTARDPRTNEHLRGGPIGERRKRGKSHPPLPPGVIRAGELA